MERIERIGVIGNGAVGMLMASLLASDYEVTLYGRVQRPEMVRIERSGKTEGVTTVPLLPVSELDERTQDVFFVTTKAHQLEKATSRLSGDVPVFLCANGIGHLDFAKRRGFGLGVVEHGVTKDGTRIDHRGLGRIRIGSLLHESPLHFTPSPLRLTWETDIEHVLLEKLFANAIINPITALARVPNGALAHNPLQDVAHAIYEELTALYGDRVPYAYVASIIEQTATNRSSMLRDVESGRKTEIDAILGPIVRRAEKEAIPLRLIPTLHKLILGANASC